ncbi:MAG TPA: hypothetical protein VHV83_18770 [Armatimonadota bacterium]|nr:hypothetical protein [Armatimonadota bacterium]
MRDSDTDSNGINIIGDGPIYRVLMRLGQTKAHGYSAWRASIFFVLFTWGPLFFLAYIQQFVMRTSTSFSLFGDFLVYARLLIVMCVFIASTKFVNPSINMVVREFRRSAVIRPADDATFSAILDKARDWSNSSLAEIITVLASYIGAFFGTHMQWDDLPSIWLAVISHGHGHLTPAGWWYLLITIPLFQWLLYHWIWRLFIWYRMLWGISRLPLQIRPAHPDLVGGLGFIIIGHAGFSFLIFAASALTSASIGNRYVYQNIHPSSYITLFAGIICVLLLIFILPLLMFTPQLIRAKLHGLLDYGFLASSYVSAFTKKWEDGRSDSKEQLLGNPDFQSLADMINGYNNIRKMRVMPFSISIFAFFLVTALVPLIPLLFTVKTAREIVDILLKLLLPS